MNLMHVSELTIYMNNYYNAFMVTADNHFLPICDYQCEDIAV